MYVSTEPYCGIRSFLSVFFSRLALQHDKTSSAFLCLPAVSTSTAQVAGAHGFLGREIRAGNDDSLWKGYRREGEAGQMKFNNCDLDMQLKKQQPKSVIQVSCSSLQGDCTKETVPRQRGLPRHCTTHSCKIILSKCVNMQNRSLMHFSSSPLHDCNIPPPLLCSSTSRTLLPKLLRGAGTQLLFHGRGRTAKSMPDSSLLPAPVCPPDKVSWAWMEVGGGRERFLISTEVCCCQQPPSAASYTNSVPSRSLFPPKTTQIVFTNTPCACALTGSM